MKLKQRWIRWVAAGAMVTIIATQIPFTNTKAAVAADYTQTGGDTSDDFLGTGIKNKDIVEGTVGAIIVGGVVGVATGTLTTATTGEATLTGTTGTEGTSSVVIAPTKNKEANRRISGVAKR